MQFLGWSKFSAVVLWKSQQHECEWTLLTATIVDPRFQCTKHLLHWAEHQLLCSVLALCGIWDVLSLRDKLTSLALNLLLFGEIMDYNQGLTGTVTLVVFLFGLFGSFGGIFCFSTILQWWEFSTFFPLPLCPLFLPHPPPSSSYYNHGIFKARIFEDFFSTMQLLVFILADLSSLSLFPYTQSH